jgi:transposase
MVVQRQRFKDSGQRHAETRSKAGQARQLKKNRTDNAVHPGKGGSEGYQIWYREDVVHYSNHFGVPATVEVYDVSTATVYRWRQRLMPYRKTGNKPREVLTGPDQLLLAMGVFIYPTATADKLAAFIINNGGAAYDRYEIYKRLKELGITWKKGSIESYDAYSLRNIAKAQVFWNNPPPMGVLNALRYRLIDIDEAKFTLKDIESRYGWSKTAVRVRTVGHYARCMSKVNLILAIEPGNPALPAHERGSIQNPRKWFTLTEDNVDQFIFADFIEHLCSDIEAHPTISDDERIFMWDNLSVHKTALVSNTLQNRESRDRHLFYPLARPPYQPKWAPIEYVFCQIAEELSNRVEAEWNEDSLRHALRTIVMGLGCDYVFNKTFAHCGY